MSTTNDWNRNIGSGFGRATPEDEYFHGTGPAGDSLTETWYWGFNIPEACINCYAYCWVHPNLGVVTAGLFIYRGRKSQHLACEVFEMRDYMSLSVVGDGSHIALPNSMEVKVIEPMEHIQMTFRDDARQSAVDVHLRAVAPAIMRANNLHFEQLMHVTGSLTLRGAAHEVDCYSVRDRSWGELRPEDHAAASPPYTWVTGAFGPDLAFNLGATDDPLRDPDWSGLLEIDPGTAFKDGWVLAGKNQRRLTGASMITHRSETLLQPLRHEVEFRDSEGDTYLMTGEVIAITPWSGWSNMNCQLGLVEWTLDGRKGWGEVMDCQWNDYVYLKSS